MRLGQIIAGLVATLALTIVSAQAQFGPPTPKTPEEAACFALRTAANTAAFAAIPDAPTNILSAQVIPAGGLNGVADDDLPEICRVEGIIAPTVGFLLRMPTKTWNGKFMMGGCGGPCGTYLEDRIDPALARGYAVVTTDMGHKGSTWLFAYNNPQNQIDFGYRATHVTAVAAKQLIAAFYKKPASRNYYWGCSTGGRQAMISAQRFPNDFEGIIGGAPVYEEVGDTPYFIEWNILVNRTPDGGQILNVDKLPMLHNAVLNACDALDGLKDGLLQNPLVCRFEPKSIQCAAADGPNCLTAAQVAVVQKFHDGARNSAGKKLYWGMPWGSEDQWAGLFISADGRSRSVKGASITGYMGFSSPFGPAYDITDFNYDRDPDRLNLVAPIMDPRNPDLSRFHAAGGKMILFHGFNDNNIPVEASLDYYKAAVLANGGLEQTKTFFRFFMLPAVNHCRGGDGGGEVDWITALENWVEKGEAPDMVTAYRPIAPYPMVNRVIEAYSPTYSKLSRHPMPPGSYDRSRPVYAWPGVARYSGRGDANVAASWTKAR